MEKPVIFYNREDVPVGLEELDFFTSGILELSKVRFVDPESFHGISPIWIHYPGSKKVFKSLPEDLYFELRTARNKNVIILEEQNKYRNCLVGIAGLSVGSAILNALVISGGPKNIKIADFDVIEITNLNRIRAAFFDIGVSKVQVAAREVWNIDPFAQLDLWGKGVNEEDLEKFISDPRLDVMIDEMDDLRLKLKCRMICKEKKIPVLMATDNGDSVILDVERFDLDPDYPPFHGSVSENEFKGLDKDNKQAWISLVNKIIGFEFLETRMKSSLLNIGKTLVGIPQLGSTAMMAGAAVSSTLRRMISGEEIKSGRYLVGIKD